MNIMINEVNTMTTISRGQKLDVKVRPIQEAK